jgi:hypothetical protein
VAKAFRISAYARWKRSYSNPLLGLIGTV